ncbi:MAG: hypothetical protein JO199_07805 [Candidatus Eremiobacteraeota bacterium]|nr:hypothetical protein [Candidatus Eremiobacteraeota bacterium]
MAARATIVFSLAVLTACGGGGNPVATKAIQTLAAGEDTGFRDQQGKKMVDSGGAALYDTKTSIPGMSCHLLESHGLHLVTCVGKPANQADADAAFDAGKELVGTAMPGMHGLDVTASSSGKYYAAYLYSDGQRAVLVGEKQFGDKLLPSIQFMPASLFEAK